MVDVTELDDLSGEKSLNNLHEDISGKYPKPDYVGTPSYAKEALGNSRTELYFNYAIDGLPIDGLDNVKSEYPLNQVQKTFSGHSFEMDDTPGAERIIIKHNTGAGIELAKDGSMTISTLKNSIQVSGGDQFVTIAGDGTINYGGNLDLNVVGDFNINCMNFNLKTRGNKTETINGFGKTKSMGQENIINGPKMDIISSQVTEVMLANKDCYVKGVSTQISGDDTKILSGKNLYMTTDGIMATSANDMNLSASSMTMQGTSGIIGGPGMAFVGTGADFTEGVSSPTFHGDLDGNASNTYAQAYASTAASGGGSITNTATPTIDKPTAESLVNYLTREAGGIRKVQIDEDFYIKNKIDPSFETGNVFTNTDEVTPDLIRSKLRNKNNLTNQKFIEYVLKTQYVNKEYFENKTPAGYGRSIKKENLPVVGTTSFGAASTTNVNNFDEKHPTKNITIDPKYNAYNLKEITSKTKLSDTISLSRFLGTHDPTNIDFIRDISVKQEIVKYLSLHAQFIEAVNNDDTTLKSMIVKPVESIYRPGEFEIIEKDSETDLKIKGRLVVYDVIDKNTGRSSPEHVFDLAAFAKDRFPFEKISLQYDTLKIDTDDEQYNARLLITLPELDDNYNGDYKQELETQFNNQITSDNELIEHVPHPPQTIPLAADFENLPAIFSYKDSIKKHGSIINRNTISDGWVLRYLADDAEIVVLKILQNEFERMMSIFGAQVYTTPQGIFPARRGSRSTKTQHLKGKAFDIYTNIYNDEQKLKLLNAALQSGFQGFGFYEDFIHIDMRSPSDFVGPTGTWSQLATWAGKSHSKYWVDYIQKNRRPNPYNVLNPHK